MNLSPVPIQKFFDNNGAPLVSGLLFTYVAGTSTKIATYTDSTGGTPNTNPIVLNFRGECALWLDPTLSYKLVIAPSTDTDPPSNPILTADNIRAGVDYSTLTAQFIGQIIWPRTAAETAATVTPTNYFYPPGNILRYGTNTTPGATDMTTAFNNALSANGFIYIPAGGGAVLLTNPADISNPVTIYGDGMNSDLRIVVPIVNAGSFIITGGSPGRQYCIASAGNTDWGACGADVVNATSMIQGLQYVIKTVGTTNFTSFGAASNTVGTIFTATGAGTGSGIVWRRTFTATAAGTGTGTACGDALRFIGTPMGTMVRDLSIRTMTNTAASVIAVEGGSGNSGANRNFIINHVSFGASLAAYCIDHRSAYGISLFQLIFNTITGSCIRLRDNAAIPNYSYESRIRDVDCTSYTGNALEIEAGNTQGPFIVDGLIAENGIGGIICNTVAGGGSVRNLSIKGFYSESLTGDALSINRNGLASFINSHATIEGAYIAGTIDVGDIGHLTIIGSANFNGVSPLCTVRGSNSGDGSVVYLINAKGFAQSGSFTWLEQDVFNTWAPTISGVTTSGMAGFYSVSGRTVTAQLAFTLTAAPTANISFQLPLAPASGNSLSTFLGNSPSIGVAIGRSGGATWFMGAVLWNSAVPAAMIMGHAQSNFWQAAIPAAWINGDQIKIQLSYQI